MESTIRTIILSIFAGGLSLNAAEQTLTLTTHDATGTLYLANFNNENADSEPNGIDGKPYAYPYYQDPSDGNRWKTIVAEPLSAANVYPYEEANFTVVNNTTTDANVSSYSFGALSWDDSSLTGVGQETIGVGDLSLNLDGTRFSPLYGDHNYNNEFAWAYDLITSNLTGAGLTFNDGVLTSVDIVADLAILAKGYDLDSLAVSDTFDGIVSFSGNGFSFDVDETKDIGTFYGPAADVHVYFDAAGTFDLVPEPQTYAMLMGTVLLSFTFVRRLRAK
ncbi:hypothetical protein [Cerasicoccus frondis]|uniref:hypothetical protein n=1 Tax=Cerasicoccus frondis TaxID=490090 RepID=UPI0028526373|nr:hypothetical protein [Cerasicoccus frondis]